GWQGAVPDLAVGAGAEVTRVHMADAAVGQNCPDQPVEWCRPKSPCEPVPGFPVRRITPHLGQCRECRKWACIPCPDMHSVRRNHAPAVDAGDRVERLFAEGWIEGDERGLEIAALDQIVTLAARIMRHACFRRFGIGKNTGLVRTLVDRRAADLGEPDGFRLRHPARRACELRPADTLVVELRPEIPDILLTEN